jgi:hypothetical protein
VELASYLYLILKATVRLGTTMPPSSSRPLDCWINPCLHPNRPIVSLPLPLPPPPPCAQPPRPCGILAQQPCAQSPTPNNHPLPPQPRRHARSRLRPTAASAGARAVLGRRVLRLPSSPPLPCIRHFVFFSFCFTNSCSCSVVVSCALPMPALCRFGRQSSLKCAN